MTDWSLSFATHAAIDDIYSYEDDRGIELFQVVRWYPRAFSQRHWDIDDPEADEEGYAWDVEGCTPIPYRLPQLLYIGIADRRSIYIVEGEKDVKTLEAVGQIATTSIGGAFEWDDRFKYYFLGATEVNIIADQDSPGYYRAACVRKSLNSIGIPANVLASRAKGINDTTEHFEAGYSLTTLCPFDVPI